MTVFSSFDVTVAKWFRILILVFVAGLTTVDIFLAIHYKIDELRFVPIYCGIVALGIHGIKDIKLGEYVDYDIMMETYVGNIDDYVTKYRLHYYNIMIFASIKTVFMVVKFKKLSDYGYVLLNICSTNLYPAILLFIFVIPLLTLELGSCLKYWVKRIRQKLWPKPEFTPIFNDMTGSYGIHDV